MISFCRHLHKERFKRRLGALEPCKRNFIFRYEREKRVHLALAARKGKRFRTVCLRRGETGNYFGNMPAAFKLQRESLRYTEAVQLADVLGFEIVWRKRGDR